MRSLRERLAVRFARERGSAFRLGAVALSTTLVVLVIGSLLMSSVYRSLATSVKPAAPMATAGGPVVVGVGRTPGGPREWVTYAAAFSQLQRDIGRPVVLKYALSYARAEEYVRARDVDIALVPISAYLNLERDDAAVLVAAPKLRKGGENGAVLVVADTSSVRSIRDLKGGTLAVTSGSLAGEDFVAWRLRSLGEPPDDYFSSLIRSEAHDSTLEHLISGQADAAAVSCEALCGWPDGKFRIIDRSPSYATPPVVARADLDPTLVASVRQSLVTMDVESLGRSPHVVIGFYPVTPEDYAFPRALSAIEVGNKLKGRER